MLKRVLPGLIIATAMMGAAVAGPLEDASAAYERGDYATALTLWKPLADQGDAQAQLNLGLLYASDRGFPVVPHDYTLAVIWYRKAADQNYPAAEVALGVAYATGRGVAQDYAEAVKWARMAAEQGIAEAQRNLAVAYANGEGVSRDYVLAYMWYSLAAAQGHKLALQNRDIVAKKLTPDQFAEAQRLAREWKPKTKP